MLMLVLQGCWQTNLCNAGGAAVDRDVTVGSQELLLFPVGAIVQYLLIQCL